MAKQDDGCSRRGFIGAAAAFVAGISVVPRRYNLEDVPAAGAAEWIPKPPESDEESMHRRTPVDSEDGEESSSSESSDP